MRTLLSGQPQTAVEFHKCLILAHDCNYVQEMNEICLVRNRSGFSWIFGTASNTSAIIFHVLLVQNICISSSNMNGHGLYHCLFFFMSFVALAQSLISRIWVVGVREDYTIEDHLTFLGREVPIHNVYDYNHITTPM